MKYKKQILKFLGIFIISFICVELIEMYLNSLYWFDFKMLKLGWLGTMIFWGFKFHIFCCLAPMIWAGYKCRHKSCEHDYCHDENK